jgi:hypothetical protein
VEALLFAPIVNFCLVD